MNNPGEILSTLEKGLRASQLSQTELTLGDRSGYLGMSDLAMALTCQRKVIANKLQNEPFLFNLNELITLERGHWLKHGIEKALKATGQNLITQPGISVTHDEVPIKAHLDFALVNQDEDALTVVELKSLSRMKDSVQPSHKAQLVGQISLLSEYWNDPVFGQEGKHGFKRFSDLMAEDFGSSLTDKAGHQRV
jgi:hypothetical protein